MDYQATEITKIEHPAEGYAVLYFAGQRATSGAPGQFVMVRGDWGTDPILPRAFSLIEVGKQGSILVRAVGKGTGLLIRMKPGDPLYVLGPQGKGFDLNLKGRIPVLVAGGVGVAPLVFLGEQLARKGASCLSIYGARTARDLPLRERLEACGNLTITTEDGSAGRKGMVTEPLRDLLSGTDPSSHVVFSCGPHGMLRAVARACGEAGVPCQVALESPMACGMGTCRGCAVEDAAGGYKYVCCDGPVFEAEEIFGGVN